MRNPSAVKSTKLGDLLSRSGFSVMPKSRGEGGLSDR